MNDTISLSQKIYLLAINPQKGGIIVAAQSAMNFSIIGTLLLELYQNKNIDFEDKRIVVTNRKSSKILHQFLLDKMYKSKKDLKIATWMNKFNFSMKYIRGEVQKGLVQKRIIRMEQKRFLFFRWKIPVIVQKQILYRLLADIENSIFKGTKNEEDILLLSFLKPAGLFKRIFPVKERRKFAQKRLDVLMVDNQVSMAVRNAILASQAVTASVAASTAAISAATS